MGARSPEVVRLRPDGGFVNRPTLWPWEVDCAMGARAAHAHLHLYPPPRAPTNTRPGFPLGFLMLLAGGRLPMAWPIGMAGIPLFAHAGLKKILRRPSPAPLIEQI